MRLGLIGWYGHDNYGDERILYCIRRYFSGYDFCVAGSWEDARCKMDALNQCDYVLIGGGGLILRNIGQYLDIIQDLQKPFGLIGVSVEAHHSSMHEFFETLKKKADFILVRDSQSKKYLDNHYKVIVGPDITFLFPWDVVAEVKEDRCGLSLRDWYYWKAVLYGRHHRWMCRWDSPGMRRIYPFSRWAPDKIVRRIEKYFQDVVPMPFYFDADRKNSPPGRNMLNDVSLLSNYFPNVPTSFEPAQYSHIRYLLGMRYHALVFAVQCGVPFLSLSYQPKNKIFCADMEMEKLSLDIYDLNDWGQKIESLKSNYRVIRESLIDYRAKCCQDIQYVFKSLLGLLV